MDFTNVLGRAWHTAWHYRALWIFGIVLALVTFSWEGATLLDRDDDWEDRGVTVTRLPGETFPEAFRRAIREELSDEIDEANRGLRELFVKELGFGAAPGILAIIGVLAGLAAVVYVAAKVARYVSETALIRMVSAYEETGERLGVRQGLRLGWSRTAWRLFLIDLVVNLLAVLGIILLFGLILAPLPLWVDGSEGVIFVFAFLTGGLFLLAIAATIVAAAAVSVWKRLARQVCAVEGTGVGEAVGTGFRILRRQLKEAGLVWLIGVGVRLGWLVAIVPLVLLLLGAGLIVGGLPGLAAAGLAGPGGGSDTPVFVGLAVGLPVFLLILVGPLVFLDGLREVFVSSLWTLTYRELRGLEVAEPEPRAGLDAPGLEVAPIG